MPEPVHVLLDEGVPEKLRHEFSEAFTVETVRYRGWTGKRNGDLLRLAEASFDALVTVDKRLRYQQHVSGRSIAVICLTQPERSSLISYRSCLQRKWHYNEPNRARCSLWRGNQARPATTSRMASTVQVRPQGR